jgi:hypothetical protein
MENIQRKVFYNNIMLLLLQCCRGSNDLRGGEDGGGGGEFHEEENGKMIAQFHLISFSSPQSVDNLSKGQLVKSTYTR